MQKTKPNYFYLISKHTHLLDFAFMYRPTCGNDGLQLGAIDERPFDGLSFDVSPIDPLLKGVVVHHRDIIDIRDR